jgi:hypothetical protein
MNWNNSVCRSLLVAGMYVLTAVVLTALRQHGVLDAAATERTMGMLMGLVVLVSANLIPKRLVPLARVTCDPAREQALRRFVGWALVLGGLGYTLAYALAPIEIASTLAISLLAPVALVVAGVKANCAWRRRNAR